MNPKSVFYELKGRLSVLHISRLFRNQKPFDVSLSEEELFHDLADHLGNDRLLGRFTEEQVWEALADYGVWKELAEKGYPNPKLVIKSIDPFRQRAKILTSAGDPEDEDHLLCELRVFDAFLHGPCPDTGRTFEVDALILDWLVFQNPKAIFAPDRPKLPGQKYPGLGIMRTCMRAILDLSRQTGKEAVVNIPEYYHNAVLYQPAFRFFSPYVEGRFLALQKFLSHLSLAEASHAIDSQRIRNQTKQEVLVWKPHEQILGLTSRISDYFTSDLYLQKVKEAETEQVFQMI